MNNNFISIKNGAGGTGDRRCKRTDCVFPKPTVRFDLDGPRVVAVWSWTGVGIASDPKRVTINVMPTMRLVPMSYN